MSNEEQSIHIIEFLSEKADWESWLMKFISHGKCKGYKKLLVSIVSMSFVNKVPLQEEYDNALEGDMDINKNCKLLRFK